MNSLVMKHFDVDSGQIPSIQILAKNLPKIADRYGGMIKSRFPHPLLLKSGFELQSQQY
jgi:hypothetical protein